MPVNGLLVDVGLRGQRDVLLGLFQQRPRKELWDFLACGMPTFEDIDLPVESSDLVVWQKCQTSQLVLLTDNRNDKGKDALERVIRTLNQPDSLPVLTLGTANRFLAETEYKHRVADKVLEYLFDIERHIGTGRLWVP
jgi:hypothetical protein